MGNRIDPSGGGGHTIQDEGVDLTQRDDLNFIGAGVVVTDNAGTGATDVTITGSGVGEANTASNVGIGSGVFKQKTVVDLEFKSLDSDDNTLGFTDNTDDIDITVRGFISTATNPASAGVGRLGTGETIRWRNLANTNDNWIRFDNDNFDILINGAQQYQFTASQFDIQGNILHNPGDVTDVNDNTVLTFSAATSAINNINIRNAGISAAPRISVEGIDPNIDLDLFAKGTGTIRCLSSDFNLNGNDIINTGTITVPTTTGTLLINTVGWTMADGQKCGFNPNATNAGVNIGQHTADPSALTNSDMWYNSTSNELKAYIDGVAVSLGSGSGTWTDSSTNTGTNKTLNSFTNFIAADELHIEVRNESGGTLNIGDAVAITGFSVGQSLPLVSLADADNASNMPAIGLVESSSIANNANGAVTVSGTLSGFDTTLGSVGDNVYISTTGTTGNTLTATRPTGTTAAIQGVGRILRSHATLGILEVIGAGRSNDVPNLEDAKLWIGNASNVATAVDLSGDITVTNAGVTTIGAKAVDVAMLADGTDGELITWDATGVAATVGAGTSGQVLTSNGAGAAPTFQDAGSGGGFWVELARTTLAVAGDTITVSGFAARESLMIIVKTYDTGGTINTAMTFNNDTASNYSQRYATNAASETTSTNRSNLTLAAVSEPDEMTSVIVIPLNIASNAKITRFWTVASVAAGEATAPTRREGTHKWDNTSAQITRVDVTNLGTGDFAIGSEVIVLGSD